MGKISVSDSKGKQRHNPLHRDITSLSGDLKVSNKEKKKSRKKEQADEEYLDSSTSRKILQLAKEQQEEIEAETNTSNSASKPSFLESFKAEENSDEDEESDSEEYSDFEEEIYDEEEIQVAEKDAEMFEKYFKSGDGFGGSVNLADKIMAKIHEKQLIESGERPSEGVKLPPKVIAAYEKIGQILANYRHGKLPKLFKVLPSLKNWQDVLYVTNPDAWTPHAVYEATKLFVSNLQANEAQKFIENVLLERFRVGIEDSEDHSVNYHIYRALKKALYKPGAFFKGFLFPLIDSSCSVREATIASSVLAKASVPVLHSSVALSQLAQREFKPSTTVFIRVLIEKKYALPYQTLDDLVFYFMRFRKAEQQLNPDQMMEEEEEDGETKKQLPPLPVVWHKAFLAFAERYKNDITDDQRDFLLETVRQRFHHSIGPEIRRELLAGTSRAPPQHMKEPTMVNAF